MTATTGYKDYFYQLRRPTLDKVRLAIYYLWNEHSLYKDELSSRVLVVKTADKREAILEATLELLVERDLQSTSMALIAGRAGVGMGTIYNYFESKEALIRELFRKLTLSLLEAMFAAYPEEASIKERFFHIWRVKCEYFIERPKEFIFTERFANSPYITPNVMREVQSASAKLDALFDDARAQGIVKDLPRAFFIPIVNGALGALIRNHIVGAIVLDEEAINVAVEACWDAIKG